MKKLLLLLTSLVFFSVTTSCEDDDSCPDGTEEIRDLNGDLTGCAVP